MQRERSLEVRDHVERLGVGQVLSDHRIGLHRRDRVTRIADGELALVRRLGERGRRFAVGELAVQHDVGAGRIVQDRRVGLLGRDRIDHRGQRLVIDVYEIQRVLGLVAVGGTDDRDRLTDVAHLVDGHAAIVHRRGLEANDEVPGVLGEFGPGHDRLDSWLLQGLRDVDGEDARVRMRRAQDGGMQRALLDRQVVNEPAPAL